MLRTGTSGDALRNSGYRAGGNGLRALAFDLATKL